MKLGFMNEICQVITIKNILIILKPIIMKILNLLKPAVVAVVLSAAVVSCSNDHDDVSTEEVEAVEEVSNNDLHPEIDSKMIGALIRELPKCPKTIRASDLSVTAQIQAAEFLVGLVTSDHLCKRNGKVFIRKRQ